MNKILFKLIEGKGKFFLNGDLVNGEIVNPEVLPISYEIVDDGEILDLPEGMGFEETEIDTIADGGGCYVAGSRNAIRLLPEKPVDCNVPDHVKNAIDNFEKASEECSKRLMVNSEKPVQREESQEDDKDDWDALGNEINKRMVLYDAFGVHPTLELIRQAKMFTIKRNEPC